MMFALTRLDLFAFGHTLQTAASLSCEHGHGNSAVRVGWGWLDTAGLMVSLHATVSATATVSVDETVTEFCSVQIFFFWEGNRVFLTWATAVSCK